jgi:hypothetical protein
LIALGALASVGALIGGVLFKVFVHLVSEEVEGRLDQVGYAVLRMACARLPAPLREDYYQEWAAELDAHFQGAAERPLTRLYWSLRFPGALVFRARSVARIQDPAVFRGSSDALEMFFIGSRAFRIFFAGVMLPTAGMAVLRLGFQFNDLLYSAAGCMFAVYMAWLSAVSLLLELVDLLQSRRGSRPSWARYVTAAADFTSLMHDKITSTLPRWGVAHLGRLARGKTRQDEVSS